MIETRRVPVLDWSFNRRWSTIINSLATQRFLSAFIPSFKSFIGKAFAFLISDGITAWSLRLTGSHSLLWFLHENYVAMHTADVTKILTRTKYFRQHIRRCLCRPLIAYQTVEQTSAAHRILKFNTNLSLLPLNSSFTITRFEWRLIGRLVGLFTCFLWRVTEDWTNKEHM